MSETNHIAEVALAVPLRRTFDYLLPGDLGNKKLIPGVRVDVPFGRRQHQTGIIIKIKSSSDFDKNKLKKINSIIDEQSLFKAKDIKLLHLASRYYHHPLGEVFFNAIPNKLRDANTLNTEIDPYWQLTAEGLSLDIADLQKAPNQQSLLAFFKEKNLPLKKTDLVCLEKNVRAAFSAIKKKNLIEICPENTASTTVSKSNLTLNAEQRYAAKTIKDNLHHYQCFLLDGITGSGKTEVYLETIRQCVELDKQVLLLTPEIGLTPQIVQRAEKNLGFNIQQYHSKLTDNEKLSCWQSIKKGHAPVVIGTRSAIWLPMEKPGLIIIDEEHDISYKQQDGFRYSARDIGILKAKQLNIPIILGSATPSLEILNLCEQDKCKRLTLKERAGQALTPDTHILSLKQKRMHGPISEQLITRIKEELAKENQVLLFLNRRGYATQLLCHACGWVSKCPRCNIAYTYHKERNKLICHHCDRQQSVNSCCDSCQSDELLAVGHGTERIEEILVELFPGNEVLRIDSDTTRKKSAMQNFLEKIQHGKAQILLGTQMLAKGHHFPNLSLVAVLDADRGLHSSDYRANERLAQLLIQVSGRAGREKTKGSVVIQTHHPEHEFFKDLFKSNYYTFAHGLLQERKDSHLPPYHYQALIRAEANKLNDVTNFLSAISAELSRAKSDQFIVYGPYPSPMEKKQGRYRMQVMLESPYRNILHEHITSGLIKFESHKLAKKVRWSIDIDPQELY